MPCCDNRPCFREQMEPLVNAESAEFIYIHSYTVCVCVCVAVFTCTLLQSHKLIQMKLIYEGGELNVQHSFRLRFSSLSHMSQVTFTPVRVWCCLIKANVKHKSLFTLDILFLVSSWYFHPQTSLDSVQVRSRTFRTVSFLHGSLHSYVHVAGTRINFGE